ncbi:LysR family transcriptional regulator [Lactiplantibacillus paraplantarum]|nr:LysR family transcriptional regulator [Lactiplantibacillus paraplantarum]WEE35593.1 LysR family transcriptional regulator [Lactiplantibacillus paraplantarum]
MDLDRLQTFLKVVQYGSFQQVAAHEYRSQRTVSKQMTQLENELQVTLFERGHNKIQLTPQGRLFWASAQDIVNNYTTALTELHQFATPTNQVLRVGYFSAFEQQLLMNALYALKKKYSALQLIIRQGSNEHLTQQVADGALDLALSISYGRPAITAATKLKAVPIYHNQMVIGVSRLNPLSELAELPPSALTTLPILYYSPESSTFLLESFLASTPFIHNYNQIRRVASAEQMHLLVALNQAFAFYPAGLVSPESDTQVAYLPIADGVQQGYDIVALFNETKSSLLLRQLIQMMTS